MNNKNMRAPSRAPADLHRLAGAMGNFTPIPAAVLLDLLNFEADRCELTIEEISEQFESAIATGYVAEYVSDSPGFVGEVVITLFAASPDTLTVWKRAKGAPHFKLVAEGPDLWQPDAKRDRI